MLGSLFITVQLCLYFLVCSPHEFHIGNGSFVVSFVSQQEVPGSVPGKGGFLSGDCTHVFGLLEESEPVGENPRRYTENMQIPQLTAVPDRSHNLFTER